MQLLLAVLVFSLVAWAATIARTTEDTADAYGEPRRMPDPSPRDRYAVTGMLDRAPIPSWG